MGWPENWEDQIAGIDCGFCTEGRPAESSLGLLIGASDVADIYFARRALVRGYAIVVWRGRHVTELHHLTDDESTRYHADVLRTGRAIESHFHPMKINYMTAGNVMPHLHTHVTARYRTDPAPGAPLPADRNRTLPEDQWRTDAAALSALLTAM